MNGQVLGRAYFANVGRTRRQGLDATFNLGVGPWSAYAAYAHTEATYRSGFIEAAGLNPAADANGDLAITPGDRLPGVPADRLKLGVEVHATSRLTLGGSGTAQSGQYLFGDEANLTPKLPAFFVLNLRAAYQLAPGLALFARVENVADRTYYTYAALSPTSAVYLTQAPNAANPRSYSPAAPFAAYGGVRFRF